MAEVKPLVELMTTLTGIFMHRSMREVEIFARQKGVSMPQFSTLMRLYYKTGACMVSDIADQMDITNAAASQLVQRLVEGGLLTRVEAAHDRRVKQLSLTPAGRELVEGGFEIQRRWMQTIADTLSPDEQKRAAAGLQALIQGARLLEAHPSQHMKIPELAG